MKPLLRVVLIVDALMLLGFGVLFLLTPWASLFNALQLVQPQPALVGQVLGVVLLGFSWLAVRSAIDGAMTAPIGRTVGHVNWIAGVLLLVWTLALHAPRLTGFGLLVAGGTGVWLLLIGVAAVRLAGAVRRRDKAEAAGAVTSRRDARIAGKRGAKTEPLSPVTSAAPAFPGLTPAVTAKPVTPVTPVSATSEPVPVRTAPPPDSVSTAQSPAAWPQSAAGQGDDARQAARDEAAGTTRPPLHG